MPRSWTQNGRTESRCPIRRASVEGVDILVITSLCCRYPVDDTDEPLESSGPDTSDRRPASTSSSLDEASMPPLIPESFTSSMELPNSSASSVWGLPELVSAQERLVHKFLLVVATSGCFRQVSPSPPRSARFSALGTTPALSVGHASSR